MLEQQQREKVGIPMMPSALPASYREEKIHDPDSPACKAWHDQLTPTEAAYRTLLWNKVHELWGFCKHLYDTAMEKLPDYNRQREEINRMCQTAEEEYQASLKSAEEEITPLEAQREVAKKTAHQAESTYRTAEAAFLVKKAAVDMYEKAKRGFTLVKAETLTMAEKVIIWVVRVVVGVALALSLGLIIGALNQYRPFTWQLVIFWFVGAAILFNSGTVINWLAEKAGETSEIKRHSGAVYPSGNKWLWLLVSTKLFFSATDAATLMFGAFRLLSVYGSSIPLPILFMVCFIFVLPYLYMETRCGWREGERKVKDYALEVVDYDERSISGITLESLAQETAKIKELEVAYKQAEAEVTELDSKIAAIRNKVVKAVCESPVDYAVGIYAKNDGALSPVNLAEFIEPPFNESMTLAIKGYWNAREKAEAFDDELKQKVLAREANEMAKQAKSKKPVIASNPNGGFISRWRAKL